MSICSAIPYACRMGCGKRNVYETEIWQGDVKGNVDKMKLLNKSVLRETRRPNTKYAAKQISKISAEKAAVKMAVAVSGVRYALGAAATSYITNMQLTIN